MQNREVKKAPPKLQAVLPYPKGALVELRLRRKSAPHRLLLPLCATKKPCVVQKHYAGLWWRSSNLKRIFKITCIL